MERHKLDSIDLRILSELQDDGRITNVELSRRAKITAPPCLRRMRALEKAGYIKGYHADLDGKALGYEVTGWAFVGSTPRPRPTCAASRNASAPGRRSASATCSRARSTSS